MNGDVLMSASLLADPAGARLSLREVRPPCFLGVCRGLAEGCSDTGVELCWMRFAATSPKDASTAAADSRNVLTHSALRSSSSRSPNRPKLPARSTHRPSNSQNGENQSCLKRRQRAGACDPRIDKQKRFTTFRKDGRDVNFVQRCIADPEIDSSVKKPKFISTNSPSAALAADPRKHHKDRHLTKQILLERAYLAIDSAWIASNHPPYLLVQMQAKRDAYTKASIMGLLEELLGPQYTQLVFDLVFEISDDKLFFMLSAAQGTDVYRVFSRLDPLEECISCRLVHSSREFIRLVESEKAKAGCRHCIPCLLLKFPSNIDIIEVKRIFERYWQIRSVLVIEGITHIHFSHEQEAADAWESVSKLALRRLTSLAPSYQCDLWRKGHPLRLQDARPPTTYEVPHSQSRRSALDGFVRERPRDSLEHFFSVPKHTRPFKDCANGIEVFNRKLTERLKQHRSAFNESPAELAPADEVATCSQSPKSSKPEGGRRSKPKIAKIALKFSPEQWPAIPQGHCARTAGLISVSAEEKGRRPWLYCLSDMQFASTKKGSSLVLRRSRIHSFGLFTLAALEANSQIIEYIGEMITIDRANNREVVAERKVLAANPLAEAALEVSSYFFRIDDHWVVDATRFGNASRFINHSCSPNCYARTLDTSSPSIVGGCAKRILLYALRLIKAGEEILYDYKFPEEVDARKRIPCHCGAPNCRKFLN